MFNLCVSGVKLDLTALALVFELMLFADLEVVVELMLFADLGVVVEL